VKCHHLQSGPLPEPYTAPCEFSTVGSNAAGPFLRASSLPTSLAITESTDSKRVPYKADLIFGNKKSHMRLGQVSRVDVPTQGSCASPETL
jgi:hypothetical protein